MWDLRSGSDDDLGDNGGWDCRDIHEASWVLLSNSVGAGRLWDPQSRITTEVLPPHSGTADALNDVGQIVGIADAHAALWNPRSG